VRQHSAWRMRQPAALLAQLPMHPAAAHTAKHHQVIAGP
jgi:hypothetical protein